MFMNAEWGRIGGLDRLQDEAVELTARKAVELELIHTGFARWMAGRESQAGTVGVRAIHERGREPMLSVQTTAYGAATAVRWTPPDSAKVSWSAVDRTRA